MKVKVKLFLGLIKHSAMKTYWGVEVKRHEFLTSALKGDEWSALHPGRLIAWEIAPGTHEIRGWMGPRAGLDAMDERKNPMKNAYITLFANLLGEQEENMGGGGEH
jgi:hypothetical protein